MHRTLSLVFALVACKGEEPTPSETTDTGTPPAAPLYSDEALGKIADAVQEDLDANLATGAQIAVWHAGELVYVKSFGTKDPNGTDPVDDETLFQIGSDTKKMTAMAVLQLVDDGVLSLDDTVADWLPAVDLAASPDWAESASLHELISHQGGLYDYTPWDDAPDDTFLRDHAEGAFAANEWAMSDPGAFYNYSNPNFGVAGLVAEAASGTPWADLVTEQIFAPLGLDHTHARLDDVVANGNYAVGTGFAFTAGVDWFDPLTTPDYTIGVVPMEDMIDNAFVRPAGLVWSTASDQARFLGDFWIRGQGDVLSDDLREAATAMQVVEYPAVPVQGYGYGWMHVDVAVVGNRVYPTTMWAHGGNTMSETSLTMAFPEKELAISILSNGYGDDFSGTATSLVVQSGLLTGIADVPVITDETDHAELVGEYVDHFFGPLVITDDGGALTVSAEQLDLLGIGYDPELAYAGGQDVYLFTVEGAPYDVTFFRGEGGGYEWLRNRLFVGRRDAVAAVASRAGSREAVLARLQTPSAPSPALTLLQSR